MAHTDKRHAMIQEKSSHAPYSQAKYRYITHVRTQAMTIKMNSDKDNMLKDDQDNIRARESTHQVERYTTSESIHVR